MRGVKGVAYRHTGQRQAAEDVAQAAFLVLAQRPRHAMRSARRRSSALPWLARVASYAASNWRRAEQRRARRAKSVAQPERSYDPSAGHDLAEAVTSAMACLPRRDRRIVEWRHLSQMSWDDVARHSGTTPDAARKAAARALAKLRQILDRRGITATGAAVVAGLRAMTLSSPTQAAAATSAADLAAGVLTMLKLKTAAVTTASLACVALAAGVLLAQNEPPTTRAASQPATQLNTETRQQINVQSRIMLVDPADLPDDLRALVDEDEFEPGVVLYSPQLMVGAEIADRVVEGLNGSTFFVPNLTMFDGQYARVRIESPPERDRPGIVSLEVMGRPTPDGSLLTIYYALLLTDEDEPVRDRKRIEVKYTVSSGAPAVVAQQWRGKWAFVVITPKVLDEAEVIDLAHPLPSSQPGDVFGGEAEN